MELNETQKKEWEQWLSERPENIKEVAKKIVPWKKYRFKDIKSHSYYTVVSYDENKNGNVTVTCIKNNNFLPYLGNYKVFDINPDNLIEIEEL